jgi:RNA polymerase sigma-70 factor (ECF subfamily)
MTDRAAAEIEHPERDPDWERVRVEAARQDPSQFAPLYEAHFEVVYAYLARRIPERAEVEDLTAEVFRKALDGLAGFEWRGAPFSAWLLRIAANALVDRARRAIRAVPAEAATVDPDQVPQPAVADALERADLFRLVTELPPDQRRVIELRFAEERSIREIASDMGRTEGAVKQLQMRALQNLRKRIRKDHAETQSQ